MGEALLPNVLLHILMKGEISRVADVNRDEGRIKKTRWESPAAASHHSTSPHTSSSCPPVKQSIFPLKMTKSKDQAANFTSVMNFSEHDNSEILLVVLPRTKGDYQCALCIFDKLVPLDTASSSGG